MKIAIVTLYGNDNYGNKLQNYALQEVLKFNNNVVETLIAKDLRLRSLLRTFFKKNTNINRYNSFISFNKYINYNKNIINMYSPVIFNKYDAIVFGSDQIWNTKFEGKAPLFYGDFKFKGRFISYAASFGIDYVDNEYLTKYKNGLEKFSNISVREYKGYKIIKDLFCINDVDIVIDPTMLLSKEKWNKISKKPNILLSKKYILNYFLGELSEERKKEIERIAIENNCEIINILDKNSPFYECGPSEFLYLEKNAFLICTDSFHSSVFAILFDRPFVVFDREQENVVSMNSRLDTLINKFKLKNRKFKGKITEENLEHDYSEAYKILEIERKKSEKFLKKALDIKE